jgi:hypothetical protein
MRSLWRQAISGVGAVLFVAAFPLTSAAQPAAGVCYDASLGTLPDAQGWTYHDDVGGNPLPYVTGGQLHESATNGGQYYGRQDAAVGFSQQLTLEAKVRVNSSNYVPNVGTGTREGYYFYFIDSSGIAYTVGLADTGFNINSIVVPNQPLTPFAIADGNFHTYRLEVLSGSASFSIDGVSLASGLGPYFGGFYGEEVLFGGVAGASRSDTDLSYFCYDTHSTPLTSTYYLTSASLLLDTTPPSGPTARYQDSAGVAFKNGNPWKTVGVWTGAPSMASGLLNALGDSHVWLGLKNSDDIGTNFDLRVEVRQNGATLVGSGETYCVQGLTRNPSLAKEVVVPFPSLTATAFDGLADRLSFTVITRIGTNGSGSSCGGHSNAVGLRLYYDAGSALSQFAATFQP